MLHSRRYDKASSSSPNRLEGGLQLVVSGFESIASSRGIGHVAPPWSVAFRPGATAPLHSERVKHPRP